VYQERSNDVTNENVHKVTDSELVEHIMFLMRLSIANLVYACTLYCGANEAVQHAVMKGISKDDKTILEWLFYELDFLMINGGDPKYIIRVLDDYATHNQHTVGVVGFRYELGRITTGEVKT
jgi:hypothetical protein